MKTTIERSNDGDFLPGDVEAQEQLARSHQLATLLVAHFVLPVAADAAGTEDDDDRACEILRRARDLLNDKNIAEKRDAFRAWVAGYEPLELPDRRKVQEFDELLTAYNNAVRAKQIASRIGTGTLLLQGVAAGASLFMPGADTGGDVAGVIGTAATRYAQPGEWLPGDIRSAALISEARAKIRGE